MIDCVLRDAIDQMNSRGWNIEWHDGTLFIYHAPCTNEFLTRQAHILLTSPEIENVVLMEARTELLGWTAVSNGVFICSTMF